MRRYFNDQLAIANQYAPSVGSDKWQGLGIWRIRVRALSKSYTTRDMDVIIQKIERMPGLCFDMNMKDVMLRRSRNVNYHLKFLPLYHLELPLVVIPLRVGGSAPSPLRMKVHRRS
jgi:hypothetical protein